MAGKKPKGRRDSAAPLPSRMPAEAAPDENLPLVRRVLIEILAARVITVVALFLICAAGVFLVNAWQFGVEGLLEATQYRKFTSHLDASIIESWLAVEVDIPAITAPEYWRASAKASPCAVVEYGGDWGAPIRRAFCGNRLRFSESYKLQGLDSMAPDVPFAWERDEHGFVVPEIRLDAKALQWLATHPADTFLHKRWPAKTALEWLRLEEDRPIEAAVVGWSARPAVMPISFDPQRPAEALPTGIVHTRQQQGGFWFPVVVFTILGLPLWFAGLLSLPLLGGLAPPLRWIFAVLLLCTLPWWTDYFPGVISEFSTSVGRLIGDLFGDMNALDRLVATDPADATLVDGSRLAWRIGDSVFADTLGQFQLVQPKPAPPTEDAALASLAATIGSQTRALSDADRKTLFANLERDKLNDLRAAGIAFLPAAKEALMDPQAHPEVRRAARRFLTEWVTAPIEQIDQYTPAYQEWGKLQSSLADVPVPEIANMARGFAIAETATKKGR